MGGYPGLQRPAWPSDWSRVYCLNAGWSKILGKCFHKYHACQLRGFGHPQEDPGKMVDVAVRREAVR